MNDKLKHAKAKAKKIIEDAKSKAKKSLDKAKSKAVVYIKKAKDKVVANIKCKMVIDATKSKCKDMVEKAKTKAKTIIEKAKTIHKKRGGAFAVDKTTLDDPTKLKFDGYDFEELKKTLNEDNLKEAILNKDIQTSVTEIHLKNCNITDANIKDLVQILKNATNLEKLYLSDNKLTYQGVKYLQDILTDKLLELHLSGNTIGDDGLINIINMFPTKNKLKVLSLTETSITKIPETFSKFRELEKLYIGKNKFVSDTDTSSNLFEKLPNLQILYIGEYNKFIDRTETNVKPPDTTRKFFSLTRKPPRTYPDVSNPLTYPEVSNPRSRGSTVKPIPTTTQ